MNFNLFQFKKLHFQLAGALVLKTPVLKLARYMYSYTPVYLYSFNYKGMKTKLGYGGLVRHVYLDGTFIFQYS